jgi:phage recombination protein Bet
MSTEVAIHELSNDKLELIKKTVAKGATDLELELFLHACKRTGLDPLMKQIYCIKRGDKMAMQTGIDGYRLIADRTGKYAGSDEPQYMVGADGFPDVASVTVTKMIDGVPCKFSASARWKEYCQDSSPMWKKMPFLMLGKCAEALALRKAFPAELSGVYTHEEMMQADNEPQPTKAQAYTASKQTAQAKIAELRVEGPARQDGGVVTSTRERMDGKLSDQQGPDAAAPFTWRMGKHKGKPITEIPLDYLTWACTNMTAEDHRMAALAEIDRLQAQDVMRFEAEQVETQ